MRRVFIVMLPIMPLALACSRDGEGPGPIENHLVFTMQPSLEATGDAIAPAVQVSVQDSSGQLITNDASDITVELAQGPSGATLGGTLTVRTVNGVAAFSDLTLNLAGTYQIKATAPNLRGTTSVRFDAADRGAAYAIGPEGGDGQTTTVGEAVPVSPSVRLTDRFGDPAAGMAVYFHGSGSVSGANPTTDVNGRAVVGGWTLRDSVGINLLYASSAGASDSAVFTAWGIAGPPAALDRWAEDSQTTKVGGLVSVPPAVRATDAYGNPVAGVQVTFAVTAGGGQVTGSVTNTDGKGIAAVGGWTLGSLPGVNTLSATAVGLTGSPVSFIAQGVPPPQDVVVTVRDSYFHSTQNGSGGSGLPQVDTISVGGTVTWVWEGRGCHYVWQDNDVVSEWLPRDQTGCSSNSVGQRFGPLQLNRAGLYAYRCRRHGQVNGFGWFYPQYTGMWGIILVKD